MPGLFTYDRLDAMDGAELGFWGARAAFWTAHDELVAVQAAMLPHMTGDEGVKARRQTFERLEAVLNPREPKSPEEARKDQIANIRDAQRMLGIGGRRARRPRRA